MKEDINTILNYIDTQHDEKIFRLREWLFSLSASRTNELSEAIDKLSETIKHVTTQEIQQIGFYYLFMGCMYYEQGKYRYAINHLQNAVNEIWGAQENKSLTHWLLGLSYRNIQQFPKAQLELKEAIHLLATNTNVNTFRIHIEAKKRQEIQQEIKNMLEQLLSDPLFPPDAPATPQPDKSPSTNNTSSEWNNASRKRSQADPAEGIPSSNKQKEENIPKKKKYADGFMTFQTLPVYEQVAAASKSGKPVINLNIIGYTEAQIIILDGLPHKVHPVKWTSNEIRIVTNDKKWGWVRIQGNSMNNIPYKTSIMNGDFVLLQFNQTVDDNDIVLASVEEAQTAQSFLTIKRYRRDKQILQSETTEKGKEYEDLTLGDENKIKLIGIAYAVAKPVAF